MNHFCTIASGNYLPFVETLFHSLKKQTTGVTLHVLMTDNNYKKVEQQDLIFYSLGNVSTDDVVKKIIHQYSPNNNYLRWTLKPAFLHHLLQSHEAVIYVDNDICFFSSFNFLFQQLSSHSILLTPHWFSQTPYPNTENFDTNFQIGLFNAGFIGATTKGLKFLEWWAEVCLYKMERNEIGGFYDDQRFLDMSLLVDEAVGIVRHPGCNIGSWNMHQNRRIQVQNEVLINGKYPVAFIHFNHETIKHILNGNDGLLLPYYKEYEKQFATTGHQLQSYVSHLNDWREQSFSQKIQRKTKIRTRLKGWLFRLSQKL